MTKHLRLSSGSAKVVFLAFSILAFTSLASTLERQERLVPFQEHYTAEELMDKQLSSGRTCRVCICAQMRSSLGMSQWYARTGRD